MAYRPHGHARVDPSLGVWKVCQRCGFWYSACDIVWQYDYRGGATPQNIGIQVCVRTCLDGLNFNNKLLVLPPDPPPQFYTLPETFAVDQANYLTTQDESILTTQSAVDLIQSIPNPASEANTTYLSARLDYPAGVVTTLYLDLFDGDPTSGGTSILLAVTGSATRINVASNVEATATFAENTTDITVTSSALVAHNVSYVGFYTASLDGTLLVSGRVALSQPLIALNTAVVFKAPDLYFDLT